VRHRQADRCVLRVVECSAAHCIRIQHFLILGEALNIFYVHHSTKGAIVSDIFRTKPLTISCRISLGNENLQSW
jgi:hypothetical protein